MTRDEAQSRLDEPSAQLLVAIGVVPQRRLGEIPRLAVEIEGAAVRRQPLRLGGRPQQHLDRLLAVVAVRVVVRDQRRPLGAVAAAALQQKPDALVQLAPLPDQQPLVRDLLRQALAEPVLVGREHALAMNDAALLELAQLRGDVEPLVGEQLLEPRTAELAPEHGGDLGHSLGLGPEPIEPGGEHLLHRARNADLLDRPRQAARRRRHPR